MHDDFLSPIWADRHVAVSGSFSDLVKQARVAFERLAARTYAAPWKQDVLRNCPAGDGER